MAIYFASDVHWEPAGEEHDGTGAFGRFLATLAHRAREGEDISLFVLGDLFDFWWERGDRILPCYEPHLAALRRAREAGVYISLLFGNRDFTMGEALARRTGVDIAGEQAEVDVGGRRVSLQHGDLLCTGDRRYQRYRRIIRSGPARRLMQLIPMGRVEAIVERMRRASRAEIARKPSASMGVADAAVAAVLARGFQVVICGHVHRPQHRSMASGPESGELIILGSWNEEQGWYAESDGGPIHLRTFPE